MPVPTPAKHAAIVAAALLIGAPTAGAALRSEIPAPPALSDGVLRIIQVIPPEPEVHAVYPLETVDAPLTNEFKRPPRAPHWGYGFPGMEAVTMWAEPQGAAVKLAAEPRSIDSDSWRQPEQWRQSDTHRWQPAAQSSAPAASPEQPSSFEPATGWLDE